MRESNNVSEEDRAQSERCLDVDQRKRRGARRTKSAQCEEEVERRCDGWKQNCSAAFSNMLCKSY